MAITKRRPSPTRSTTPMLSTDAVFWQAEKATPQLRPQVGALVLLDQAPEPELFRDSIERFVRRVPRLRHRVAESWLGLGPPVWEEQSHFELGYHVRDVRLPAPATQRNLLDFTAAIFASPLDHLRPLWEAYLIEGLEGGRAALFFKAHHTVADGVGSLALFDALTESNRKTSKRLAQAHSLLIEWQQATQVAVGSSASENSLWSAASAAGQLAVQVLRDPSAAVEDLSRAVQVVNGVLSDWRAMRPIANPLVKDSDGIGRHIECLSFSLAELREVKDAFGVSLNDVALAVVAGALGRYHERYHGEVDELHCMVPVSLREADERDLLGNRVGGFNVTLPVGERSALGRLARIHSQTQAAKGDRRSTAYPLLMGMASMLPLAAFRALAQQAVGRFHLICTNIPGPPPGRFLAGAEVEAIYPIAPLLFGAPLSVALLSYGESRAVGIDSDPAAFPHPEIFRQHLQEAADELVALVRPSPQLRAPRRKKRIAPGVSGSIGVSTKGNVSSVVSPTDS